MSNADEYKGQEPAHLEVYAGNKKIPKLGSIRKRHEL
jgi:hypothetical protein